MQRIYSFIIPVFNRPQEVMELLESFANLDFTQDFEIVLVEDGSTETAEKVVNHFSDKLSISYYFKENSGPGVSRNFGMEHAEGNYFIILDSDCIVPRHYLKTVDSFLNNTFYHCFGGPDAAHKSFSPLQKAINYTMTSFFTTGGIRGSKTSINRFEPRSFNMGISKEAFEKTGGYAKIHPGEDPDLSQRILKAGYKTTFLPDAFVYHKRRISWKKFYIQVKKFGLVRPILNKWHPSAAKITFWFPTLFVLFVVCSILLSILISTLFLIPILLYLLLILIDSSIKNKSVYIGILSVIAVFIQFFGYGMAFLKSSIFIKLLKKDPQKQFPSLFFS
ncbi:glycosyl transferase [Aequorivita sublithincola DSM 14238]|uniref:Glycosyl transferase n=1 Tax=Aequorivita sublithincola (strain DSM 14238 / LMG 21431 / ACAM 643 / 9-3) TaxID=746697 RepID=I3Z083_AEQSU|nr:glycosyltransferase [Aequorivita sublithincola]AFL82651.1 glycosyl transferase [Aequorivita sublithincola DSM 14238]